MNAVVDSGPASIPAGDGEVNILYVNVTICVPGSATTCQTIDHVQVDTGSQGLRIIASALNSTMLGALKIETVNNGALAECTQFVDGYCWGPIVRADLHIGGADTVGTGESAPNLPVQVIGTTTYSVPNDCSSTGSAENTVAEFGANGIIGLGLFDEDCGTGCSTTADNTFYYSCPSTECVPTEVALTSQMINPLFGLAANSSGVIDNNGVIIELPAVGATGAASVTGSVVFGIGTQSNNALASSATVMTTDPYYGYVTVNFIGTNFTQSYLDSGSNAFYFNDSSIPACTQNVVQGFMCPNTVEPLTATITGANNQAAMASFSIGDAYTLLESNPTYAAFSNLGGTNTFVGTAGQSTAQTFAFGLPFFYGRNVYTAMENTNAGGTMGPYFAF